MDHVTQLFYLHGYLTHGATEQEHMIWTMRIDYGTKEPNKSYKNEEIEFQNQKKSNSFS